MNVQSVAGTRVSIAPNPYKLDYRGCEHPLEEQMTYHPLKFVAAITFCGLCYGVVDYLGALVDLLKFLEVEDTPFRLEKKR